MNTQQKATELAGVRILYKGEYWLPDTVRPRCKYAHSNVHNVNVHCSICDGDNWSGSTNLETWLTALWSIGLAVNIQQCTQGDEIIIKKTYNGGFWATWTMVARSPHCRGLRGLDAVLDAIEEYIMVRRSTHRKRSDLEIFRDQSVNLSVYEGAVC